MKMQSRGPPPKQHSNSLEIDCDLKEIYKMEEKIQKDNFQVKDISRKYRWLKDYKDNR